MTSDCVHSPGCRVWGMLPPRETHGFPFSTVCISVRNVCTCVCSFSICYTEQWDGLKAPWTACTEGSVYFMFFHRGPSSCVWQLSKSTDQALDTVLQCWLLNTGATAVEFFSHKMEIAVIGCIQPILYWLTQPLHNQLSVWKTKSRPSQVPKWTLIKY